DDNNLVSVLAGRFSNIWTASDTGAGSTQQISSAASRDEGVNGVAWMPDGKILYLSRASGRLREIWIMDQDGSRARPLWTGTQTGCMRPSPDGRYILYSSSPDFRSPFNVWRMDKDGKNPRPLTRYGWVSTLDCSPDGKWVVYSSDQPKTPALWKVPMEG